MKKYKKTIIVIIIFLIVGELIHKYIKNYLDKKNKNNNTNKTDKTIGKEENNNKKAEAFTNYNELPYISNLSKSQPRNINNNGYKPDSNLQPIIITTKVNALQNGNLPVIGYYGNNRANTIPINILRKYIIPCEYIQYKTNDELYNQFKNGNMELGIIRDMTVINGLTLNNSNENNIKVIAPMYYETVFLLSTKELKDLTHFQMINLLTEPIKLYTSKNDKPLLDIIIAVTNIDTTKIEIYEFDNMEKAALSYILDSEGLYFCCCHFKNPILQNLLDSISCLTLDYIPTRSSMYAIGGYSFKNPISNESLDKKINNLYETLVISFNANKNMIGHNLSKNKLNNRSGSKMYRTFNLRTSLYLTKLKSFSDKQLHILSNKLIEWYQTMSTELDKWNDKQELNNVDDISFKLDYISFIDSKLEIVPQVNDKLKELGYIYAL